MCADYFVSFSLRNGRAPSRASWKRIARSPSPSFDERFEPLSRAATSDFIIKTLHRRTSKVPNLTEKEETKRILSLAVAAIALFCKPISQLLDLSSALACTERQRRPTAVYRFHLNVARRRSDRRLSCVQSNRWSGDRRVSTGMHGR